MSLSVKCWVCGRQFRVKRPVSKTYDRVIGHVENKHPASALPFLEAMRKVDEQLPKEFHEAVIEGRDYPGCSAP